MSSIFTRFSRTFVLLLSLALPASATWSIVIVDRRTGEIAVGCATCISGFGIRRAVPVIVVGQGIAAAQSQIDATGLNRQLLTQLLTSGSTPAQILTALEAQDANHQGRQYGILSLSSGDPLTFTGSSALAWGGGVVGQVGDLQYAIQGNILAGPGVVMDAEAALLNTSGDMSQRLMAAMIAARQAGGDSRCNCSPGCGVPPPAPFFSSYTAFVGIARLGDVDGPCDFNGCAEGSYYLKRQVNWQLGDPDPVDRLVTRVAAWRALLSGRPDHLRSSVGSSTDDVPVADGQYSKDYTIALVDVDGVPLTSGGASITIAPAVDSVPFTTSSIADNGDGTYSFTLVAGTLPGIARMQVVVDDGVSPVTLAPFAEEEFSAASSLSRAPLAVSASVGGRVEFVIAEPSRAGAGYLLLGSASGTLPGIVVGGVLLPLNPDSALNRTLVSANTELLPNTFGVLDALGEARASFVAPPAFLASYAGGELSFAAVIFQPLSTTPPVTVSVNL